VLDVPRVEIRFHGRGGQGAVTAAKVLASAAVDEGKYALAFPEYGAERRGAPVLAFTRIDEKPILEREPILEPDIVVVFDPSLEPEIYMKGLKPNGMLVINTKKTVDQVVKLLEEHGLQKPRCIARLDATDIALKHLRAPIVNTSMLAALVRAAKVVRLETLEDNIRKVFAERPHIAEANIKAMEEAYNSTEVVCL